MQIIFTEVYAGNVNVVLNGFALELKVRMEIIQSFRPRTFYI